MKKLFTAFLLISSISVMAGVDVYSCMSDKGQIIVKDFADSSFQIDSSAHEVTNMDESYSVLGGETEYVLTLSSETSKGLRNRFINTVNKTYFKLVHSGSLQTCKVSFSLNKIKEEASISYSCSTLFKKTQEMNDILDCTYTVEK